MTREQLETIHNAMTVLPVSMFTRGKFYDPTTQTYCWWGWLAKRLGMDVAKEGELAVWHWLTKEFGYNLAWAHEADLLINHYSGSPETVNKYMLDFLDRVVTRQEQLA